MSSGLGRALAEGFTGFMAGQQQREERDYRRRMDEERVKRDTEMREFQKLVAQHSMRNQDAQNQRAENAAAIEMDQAGYAPYQPDAYKGAVDELAPQAAGPMGQFGPMVAFLADHQARQQVQPGRPMKVKPSDAERTATEQRKVVLSDRADNRAYDTQRDERNFGQQRQLMQEGQSFTASENAKNRAATAANRVGVGSRALLPTEGERKANALLTVAEAGYNTLESLLQNKDGSPKGAPGLMERGLQRIGGGAGNLLTSDQMRQVTQAGNQLSDMWLRYTSGAAVPEQEVERFALTFTPLPGDDPTTLAQKAAARGKIIDALRAGAGRAAPAGPAERPPLQNFLR